MVTQVRFPPRLAPRLPIPPTRLIGRDQEIRLLTDLLRWPDTRFITLTGPGGVGKTRLAVQVAADLGDAFAGRVYVVELAAIADATFAPSAIALAIGLDEPGQSQIIDRIKLVLDRAPALLVLDNLEHLPEIASTIVALIADCPDLKILATSRARLRVRGEQEFEVVPLATPEPGPPPPLDELAAYGAVRLFVDRTVQSNRQFTLSQTNAADVAELCRRLDGLPLAIELAASRSKVLSPRDLVDRIARRLDVLCDGPRDLPPRQQTLRATVAWTYDRLPAQAQALFRMLSVFAGGFTLDAVEAVYQASHAGDESPADESPGHHLGALDALDTLLDHNLVRAIDLACGDRRFTMLETIRAFGIERLQASGDEDAVRRLHAGYVLALAERAEPYLSGRDQGVWSNRLDREFDNVRAALDWSLGSGEIEIALRTATALERYWIGRIHWSEGLLWLTRILDAAEATDTIGPASRARVLNLLGFMAIFASDVARGAAWLDRAISAAQEAGADRVLAKAYLHRASIAQSQEEFLQAIELGKTALHLARDLGDTQIVAATLGQLGACALFLDEFDEAERYFQEALPLDRSVGDLRLIAGHTHYLAYIAAERGEFERGRALFAEALRLMEETQHEMARLWILHGQSRLELMAGRPAAAAPCVFECLTQWHRRGDVAMAGGCLFDCAHLALVWDRPVQAARLLGAARSDGLATRRTTFLTRFAQAAVDATRQRLGDEAFEAAASAGRDLSLDQAVAEALALTPPSPPLEATIAPAPSALTAHVLTPREIDVLRLLATGNTDRQIADLLSISPATVSTHVKHILQKLDVPSRSGAASRALQLGLM
jgi:predicted ATPase/DNA-binding CsgD family transcriptional regulator